MVRVQPLRSISFDTSFLASNDPLVDTVIRMIARDRLPCFITATVASELEQLKIWGRISEATYKKALQRWARTHATTIDFKNRLLSDTFGQACISSMEKHHGVQAKDIVNDCSILITTLKHGVDVFLSEDFHFTSRITQDVIHEITSAVCAEYHQMCGAQLYSVTAKTFVDAYRQGSIDVDYIETHLLNIRKKGKVFKGNEE